MKWQIELWQCSPAVFAHVAVDAFRRLSQMGRPPELDAYLGLLSRIAEDRGFAQFDRFNHLLAVTYELSEGSVVQVTSTVAPLIRTIDSNGEWSEMYDEVLSLYGLSLDRSGASPAERASSGGQTVIGAAPASVTYVEPAAEPPRAAVVIMCALSEEFDAFAHYFTGSSVHTGVPASRKYRMTNDDVPIVLVGIGEVGNIDAALATRWAIEKWRPGLVLLAGIAGGIESSIEGFCLGDLIVPPQIVGYEWAKVTNEGPRRRLRVATAGARALNLANEISRESAWHSTIAVADPTRPDAVPQVHFGDMLSGEKVLASIDVIEDLARSWPGSIGVEMEAVGLAIAAYRSGTAPDVLVAKAACDWADTAKDDTYHPRAASVSAAYCMGLARRWSQRYSKEATAPIRRTVRTDGLVKNAFSNRTDNIDAKALGNILNIERRYTKVWETGGDIAQHIWEWAEDRRRLDEMPDKLLLVGRPDLALLFYEEDDSTLALLSH